MTTFDPTARHPQRATLTIPEAGRLLGIGRGSAYQAAREGQIPVLRIGRRLLVSRAAIEQMLGVEAKDVV